MKTIMRFIMIFIVEFMVLFIVLFLLSIVKGPEFARSMNEFFTKTTAGNGIGGILFFMMASIAWNLAGGKKKRPPPLIASVPPVTNEAQIGDTKKCPHCAETIKLEATVCRFCNHAFSEQDVAQTKREIEAAAASREAAIAAEQQQSRASVSQRKARTYKIVGWVLSAVAIFFLIGTVGTLIDPIDKNPREPIEIFGLFVVLILVVVFPACVAWYSFSRAKKFKRDALTTAQTVPLARGGSTSS